MLSFLFEGTAGMGTLGTWAPSEKTNSHRKPFSTPCQIVISTLKTLQREPNGGSNFEIFIPLKVSSRAQINFSNLKWKFKQRNINVVRVIVHSH